MNNSVINTDDAPKAIGPYSQARRAGDFVFLSGQLPINPETGTMPLGIENQTRQSLRNIQAILAATGLSLSDVIKNTVFLVDLGDFKAMNEAYQEYFPNCPPSRSCVQVSAVPKGALVEIETVAFVNKRL